MVKLKKWSSLVLLIAIAFSAISFVPSVQKVVADSLLTVKPIPIPETIELSPLDLFDQYAATVYTNTGLANTGLDPQVFKKALTGYYNFKKVGLTKESPVVTIIDFNLSSQTKRLWVIDLEKNQLLYNTLVAHGQGSGDDMATRFSNTVNSHQSSLGFYITSEIYRGKHGISMKLDGMDEEFNGKAKSRAVVIHGADYVSQDFIDKHGRLGRSYGCPALPVELTQEIINTIKGNTCLFINGPQNNYTSEYLDKSAAAGQYMMRPDTLTSGLPITQAGL